MKKFLILILLTSSLAAQNELVPEDQYHPGPRYSSRSTGRTWVGAARAARAGNRMGITVAQIGGGLLMAGIVTGIALITANNGSSHSH